MASISGVKMEIDKEQFIEWAKSLQEERRLLLELDWTKFDTLTLTVISERVEELNNMLDSRYLKLYYYFASQVRKTKAGLFIE